MRFRTNHPAISFKGGCFTAELSSLGRPTVTHAIVLESHLTGNEVTFVLESIDKDASGEDTYGWHYRARHGNLTFLLIND